jgi:hypothetical protein
LKDTVFELRKLLKQKYGSEKMRKCPCSKDCPDRNATCHMKGKCPHDFEEWAKENEEERERIHDFKMSKLPPVTAAKERRHFNWIKSGLGNSKK